MTIDEGRARALARQVVLGELPADDPALVAALLEHPHVALELEELRGAQHALDATARLERAMLAEPAGDPPLMDVARELRALAARPAQRPRRRSWWPGLLAAVVLAGAAWWLWSGAESPPAAGGRQILDPQRLEISGCTRIDGGFVLRWTPAPGVASYRVRVRGDGLDVETGRLEEAQWILQASETAAWPATVEFTVLGHDDMGIAVRVSPLWRTVWPPR